MSTPHRDTPAIAFAGDRLIAKGPLADVARAVANARKSVTAPVLVFDAETSAPIELDLRGSADDAVARIPVADPAGSVAPASPRGPGRPKLGVVGREVTLLPRHWDWLAEQPGGASVTLRRLVEQARLSGSSTERRRQAMDSAYRFMLAVAGDRPGYEEATRALYARDGQRFAEMTSGWPTEIRNHARYLAAPVFGADE